MFLDSRLPNRFWDKTIPEPNSGCWLWIAGTEGGGYGQFRIGNAHRQSHRVAYSALIGPIPEGLDLDHLCRTRCCVNPAHLDPVSRRENLLRGDTITARNAAKTHCLRGHVLAANNVWVNHGKRQCKTCFYQLRNARKAGV